MASNTELAQTCRKWHALKGDARLKEAAEALERSWRSFETDQPPHACRLLVTNNINALDAHGQMSHIWIGHPIKSAESGQWATFDSGDRKIHNLTHWMPLPSRN